MERAGGPSSAVKAAPRRSRRRLELGSLARRLQTGHNNPGDSVVWPTLTSDTPGRAKNGNLLVARHWFFAYIDAILD